MIFLSKSMVTFFICFVCRYINIMVESEAMEAVEDNQNNNLSRCKLFDVNNDISESQGGLSYQEKMNILENDVETLYEFALSNGFTTSQMKTCFLPMLGGGSSLWRRIVVGSRASMVVLAVVVALFAVLWAVPETKKMITGISFVVGTRFIKSNFASNEIS